MLKKQIHKNKFMKSNSTSHKKQIRKTNRQKQINMLKTQIHKNKFIKQIQKTNS